MIEDLPRQARKIDACKWSGGAWVLLVGCFKSTASSFGLVSGTCLSPAWFVVVCLADDFCGNIGLCAVAPVSIYTVL